MLLGTDFSKAVPRSLFDVIHHPPPIRTPFIGNIDPKGGQVIPRNAKVLFGGDTKIGKSWLGLNLVRAVITGEPLYNVNQFVTHEVGRVLLIDQELGPNTLGERCEQVFDDVPHNILKERALVLSRFRGMKLTDPRAQKWLTDQCVAEKIKVLYLDPIGKLHSYEENDNTAMNKFFDILDKILDATAEQEMSIVMSHHFSKSPKDNAVKWDKLALGNFRGAGVFISDPDTLITVNRIPDTGGREDQWKYQTRWTFRHGKDLAGGDLPLYFNKYGNCRVTWEGDDW